MCEAGPFIYDIPNCGPKSFGASIPLAAGGIHTTYMQFSKTRDSYLPTHFGERYGSDLRQIPNLNVVLHANVTGLRLAKNAQSLDRLDVATLQGNRFTVGRNTPCWPSAVSKMRGCCCVK